MRVISVQRAAQWHRPRTQDAGLHGRQLVLDREDALESTGHGLLQLQHGADGRAGGGEKLGGIRAVKHHLQLTAVQDLPRMLAAITDQYMRGAPMQESELHHFRKRFEDLVVGD